tara:strand:- start:6000 stop:7355 length:1356 start_codon:yes stop_codon:yes gene_type:complete
MAVSFIQQPNLKICAAYDDIAYTLQNGATSQFFHKYILKVYVNQSLVATLKASANEQGNGVFKIENILQDFCTTDIDGYISTTGSSSTLNGVTSNTAQHAIHKIDAFANNKSNLIQFRVEGTEEYSTTADGTVTEQAVTAFSLAKSAFNAVTQIENGYETFNGFDFVLSSVNNDLITGFDSSINRKLRSTDYHTVAFLNGKWGIVGAQQSEPDKFVVKFYNDANVQQGSTIDYDIDAAASNGAFLGSLLHHTVANSFTHEAGLVYFGCGAKNITNNGATIPAAATYYTVQAENGGSAVSKLYTFVLTDEDCKGYETIRLAYLNRLGAYDYYNFNKRSTRTTAVQKNTFKKAYGNYQDQTYSYGVYQGGTNNYGVTANETIEANTDFISEAEAAALEELFTSPSVFMQNANGDFEPVVITESEYIKQTSANDKVIQYTIGLHKAHNKRIQRN